MRFTILIFLFLFLFTPVFATEFFVSTSGDDNNSGDWEHPLRTISEAYQISFAGDTVSLLSGVFYESLTLEQGGVAGLPLVFRAYPGEDVTIKAQSSNCFLVMDSVEYVNIEGFNLTKAYPVGEPHGAGVRILGNYCSVLHNRIYDCHMAVFIETFTTDTSISNHHNFVFGNVFSDIGEAAVRVKRSDHNRIINNLFVHNGYTLEPAGAMTFYGADSTIVLNNTFWDNAGPAIDIYPGTNQLETPVCTNSLLANNICLSDHGGILFKVGSPMVDESSNEFSHNIWFNGDPGSKIVIWNYDNFGYEGENLNFDEYLEAAERANPQNGVGSMETDPLYADPTNWIFDYPANSPAVDAGILDLSTLGIEGLTALLDQSPDVGIPDLGFHHQPNAYYANPPIAADNTISVFPNPSSDIVYFDIQLVNLRYKFLPAITIYNILGQKITELSATEDDKLDHFRLEWKLDEAVSSGLYFAVFRTGIKKSVSKVVIIK